MAFYSYIFLLMILSIIILLFRTFILWKKSVPVELFVEALRNENNGNFEEAIITYETALNKSKKIRFFSNSLENKIIEKIKVLHTIIDYKNNLRFTR
jgi:hypothetical protein